jgi:hypothetical protein
MRAERTRLRRDEHDELEDAPEAPPHPVLALQGAAGNAAVTRMLAREVKQADKTAMTSWGRTPDKRAEYFAALSDAEAAAKIAAFCKDRATKVKKNPPTFDEVVAELGLGARGLTPPVAAAKVVEGLAFDKQLLVDGDVSVGFDHHQNKHQWPQLGSLKTYSGGKARNQYDATATIAWHTGTTAPIMVRWVNELDAAGSLDPAGTKVNSATGEDLFGEGHLFVATAMKDGQGKLYGSYHCYPE